MRFVGATGNARDLRFGHEIWTANRRGAEEDFGGFRGHQSRCQYGVWRRTESDQPVILQQNDARRAFIFRDVSLGSIADFARDRQTRIDVGNEDTLRAAADNFVWKNPMLSEIAGARGAENLVHAHRMGVADKFDAVEREQPGVENGFHAGLFGLWIDARVEERLV